MNEIEQLVIGFMQRNAKHISCFTLLAVIVILIASPASWGHVNAHTAPTAIRTTATLDTVHITVSEGWNLISLPLAAEDARVSVLFPTAVSPAFTYDGTYTPQVTLSYLIGYWLKFAAPETVIITGTVDPMDTVSVQAGWNLIGAAAPTAVSEILSSPYGIVISRVFAYNPTGGYIPTDTMRPAKAYWLKCSNAGKLTMTNPGTQGPVLIAPANRSTDQSTALDLRWRALPNAVTYHVQLGGDPFFSNVLVDDSTLTDTTKQLCGLPLDSSLYWRVQANLSADSVSGWSATWTFQTIVPSIVPDSLAIFASVDGDQTGLWVFDPNTLQPIDSLVLNNGNVPFYVEISPDGLMWYALWGSNVHAETLYRIDAHTKNILQRVRVNAITLTADNQKRYLITSGWFPITEFRDRLNFEVVQQDSPNTVSAYGVMSMVDHKYYGPNNRSTNDRFLVYDLDSFRIERRFNLADSARQSTMQGADDDISPDGRYFYATIFNWVGPGGYGTFHIVDLTIDSVVAELPCGAFAQIGVSPDGKYIYLTDPAGYAYDFPPIGKVLRYNVESKTMENFIDWTNLTGLSGVYVSEEILVSPDSKIVFLTVGGNEQGCNGSNGRLVAIDVGTRSLIGIGGFQPNSRNNREQIRRLKWGKYLKQ